MIIDSQEKDCEFDFYSWRNSNLSPKRDKTLKDPIGKILEDSNLPSEKLSSHGDIEESI